MICANCGNQIPNNATVCPLCGMQYIQNNAQVQHVYQPAAQPIYQAASSTEKKKKSFFPAFIITLAMLVIAVVILVITGLKPKKGGSAAGSVEGNGFKSPIAAAEHYLEALRDGDVNEMLACCAVESLVDNYDAVACVERYTAIIPSFEVYVQESDFDRSLNIERRRAYLANQISRSVYVLSGSSFYIDNFAVSVSAYDSAKDLVEDILPTKLDKHTSTIIKIDEISDQELLGDKATDMREYFNSKIKGQYMDIYGCDDYASVSLQFECDGITYCFFADAAKYGGKWYICQLGGYNGSILGLPTTYGGIVPKSEVAH